MARFSSLLAAVCAFVLSATAADAQCTDVHLVFARGTNEPAGLGQVGIPLAAELPKFLPGKTFSSYAVNYAANAAQTSAGPGATDMTNHIVSYTTQCPNSQLIIGGYSQGASVTVISIGIRTVLGTGKVIPTNLAPKIKAVVTFGNPLRLLGQTISRASALYGPKSIDDCNPGDPVCGAGFNVGAHLSYDTDGSVPVAARQAAALLLAPTVRNLRGSSE